MTENNRIKSNFDFLRVFAAFLVLTAHANQFIPGRGYDFFDRFEIGQNALVIFFTISGFLVTRSLFYSKTQASFMVKRCLRIFPGLVVAVLFTVFFLGPCLTALPAGEYFNSAYTYPYLLNAVLLFHPTLPSVFENMPYRPIVNGSLYTLQLEFVFYFVIFTLGVFLLFS